MGADLKIDAGDLGRVEDVIDGDSEEGIVLIVSGVKAPALCGVCKLGPLAKICEVAREGGDVEVAGDEDGSAGFGDFVGEVVEIFVSEREFVLGDRGERVHREDFEGDSPNDDLGGQAGRPGGAEGFPLFFREGMFAVNGQAEIGIARLQIGVWQLFFKRSEGGDPLWVVLGDDHDVSLLSLEPGEDLGSFGIIPEDIEGDDSKIVVR